MIFEKKNNGSQPRSRKSGGFRFLRSRSGKKRVSLGKTDFWQALSSAALSAPHAPVLRRLHD